MSESKQRAALSPKWLRRARRLNPHYRGKLGWTVPGGWPNDPSSIAFAQRVAAAQAQQGLTVDGILGPKTRDALRGQIWQPPTSDHLIIAGERVGVPFPVVSWDEPDGLSFYDHQGWSSRKDPTGARIGLFVLHWDGCTSAHQCFHVLLERRLSVHLLLDGDGTVYQALDLAGARAWHAGNHNEHSIGVEIQNPVYPHRNRWQTPPRPVITEPRVHEGGSWEHLDFYAIQKQRVVELAQILCERFAIPRALPTHEGGVLEGLAPARFRGVCGHYHLSENKPDPGLSLWPELQAEFSKPKTQGVVR